MQTTNYFAQSWALFTREKGWMKPALVLTAALFVPVAGPLAMLGYGLEWARLSAWGMDGVPKQRGVNIGACIMSGLRGLVVQLGWSVVPCVCTGALLNLLLLLPDRAATFAQGLVQLVFFVFSAFFWILCIIAQLRCAVYEKIGAGYDPVRIVELVRRDIRGFLRLCLTGLGLTMVLIVASFVLVALCMLSLMPLFAALLSDAPQITVAGAATVSIMCAFPLLAIGCYVLMFAGVCLNLVTVNAVGLWMRQFNVPSWGSSRDPLPDQTL